MYNNTKQILCVKHEHGHRMGTSFCTRVREQWLVRTYCHWARQSDSSPSKSRIQVCMQSVANTKSLAGYTNWLTDLTKFKNKQTTREQDRSRRG